MKALQNHLLIFLIALAMLGFSVNSFIDLSTVPIESHVDALWSFIAITLTLTGLLISPVLILMSLGALVKSALHPTRKRKQ